MVMPKVFISHASNDRDFVEREIIAPLEQHGIRTWYSKDKIKTATLWEKTIREGLNTCDWFLVAVTPNALASDWVQAEVQWALDHRKGRVVPVLCADCNPEDLHLKLLLIQRIDFRHDIETERKKLLALWGADPTPEQLYGQAEAACQEEDWVTAIAKLQSLLQTQPTHAAAQTLLQQAQLRQEITNLYASGQAHFQAGHWREALADLERVHEQDANYKDVARLVAEAQEQLIAARISVLFQETDTAAASENWAVAIKKLEEILSVKPAHAEAQHKLTEAHRRQSQAQYLAWLYEAGLKLSREARWEEALAHLYVVRSMAADYKDVAALIAEAEAKKLLEEEGTLQASASPVAAPPAPPVTQPAPPPAQPAQAAQPAPPPAQPMTPAALPVPSPTSTAPAPLFVAGQRRQSPLTVQLNKLTQNKRRLLAVVGPVVLLVTIGLIAYLIFGQAGSSRNGNVNLTPRTQPSPTDNPAAVAHFKRGEEFFKEKRFGDAEQELREAVRLQSDNHQYHYSLAIVLFSQKRYAEAEAEAREALKEPLDASYSAIARYYVQLGDSLRMQGKRDDAAEAYRSAQRTDPDNQAAQTGLNSLKY